MAAGSLLVVLFAARCPVQDSVRGWIDANTGWLRREFGDAPLSAPVILPTGEFFPARFGGTDSDVRDLVARIAGYMGAQNDIRVDFKGGPGHSSGSDAGHPGSAGHPETPALPDPPAPPDRPAPSGPPAILRLDRSVLRDQARLIAVIAHAIGRARLVGERRVPFTTKNLEQLADLSTIYLGMGIFTAKTSADFAGPGERRHGADGRGPRRDGARPWRRGYLTEEMFGYALARYTLLRGDPDPAWAAYLDGGPRRHLRHAIRYLRR